MADYDSDSTIFMGDYSEHEQDFTDFTYDYGSQTYSETTSDTFENYSSETDRSSWSRSLSVVTMSDQSEGNNVSAETTETTETAETTETTETKGTKRECEVDEEGPNKKNKVLDDSVVDDEGSTCPVCMDLWSNTGDHRVCCLKCGHLFGYSCLKRWMHTLPVSKRTCPTCKLKAHERDIRFLYVKRLIAVDTLELETVKTNLEASERERTRLQTVFESTRLKNEQTIQRLEREITHLQLRQLASDVKTESVEAVSVRKLCLYMDKSLEISRLGGCRVFDYHKPTKTVAVSMNNGTNPLYAGLGYGIRKVSLPSYRHTAFIALHQKPIRDVAYRPGPSDKELITVSLDGNVKLVDMSENRVVSTFHSDGAIWSCAWDCDRTNTFYVGEARGGVTVFDIRNPQTAMKKLEIPDDASPVVSLCSIPTSPNTSSLVLCCKLNSCWAFNIASENHSTVQLPIDGPFTSLTYEKSLQRLLISTRRNQKTPYVRHIYSEITPNPSFSFHPVKTFQGAQLQQMLTHSCLFSYCNNPYIAAYHEEENNVTIWNASGANRAATVPAHQPVLDIRFIDEQDNFLATLNDNKLDFFKIINDV